MIKAAALWSAVGYDGVGVRSFPVMTIQITHEKKATRSFYLMGASEIEINLLFQPKLPENYNVVA